MPHADMAESVENAFVGENARRHDELVQYVGETSGIISPSCSVTEAS